jgi:hypothetical protein
MISHFRVSVLEFFECFQSFHFDSPFISPYEPSMMIIRENERVLMCLPEFDWRFELDSSENLDHGCVPDASGKFCKETENRSVLNPLLLLRCDSASSVPLLLHCDRVDLLLWWQIHTGIAVFQVR